MTWLSRTNRSERLRRSALAAALLAAVLASACAPAEGDDGEQVGQVPADEPGVRIVNVEVASVTIDEFTDYVRVTGEVEAFHDIVISAEESGRVKSFLVDKGRRVGRGQAIAQLEDNLLAAQVDEARASAELAREQYERQRQLWEEDKMGTEIAFLQAKYLAEQAAARRAQLEERLARTVIVAPVAGVFDEKYLEEGEMATIGARVARVVATSRVKIAAGIPERYARSVRVGNAARIRFDIFPGREFEGRIGFVGSSVDPGNRTFPIEIVMTNPDRVVKPHMVANVQVQHEQLQNVIVVPQQVVQRAAEGYKVFVAEERDGRLHAVARQVTLGPSSQNRTVILEGLNEGDRLITLGHKQVDDGSRIRVVNDDQHAASEDR
jgi:RND family efflux transporter MFP subunit